MKNLYEIPFYQCIYVKEIHHHTAMKRRLMDLGFTIGSEIMPLMESISKNMRAFKVKGCVIALRKQDAMCIMVEEKRDGSV